MVLSFSFAFRKLPSPFYCLSVLWSRQTGLCRKNQKNVHVIALLGSFIIYLREAKNRCKQFVLLTGALELSNSMIDFCYLKQFLHEGTIVFAHIRMRMRK